MTPSREIMEDYNIKKMYKVTWPTGHYRYFTADELTLASAGSLFGEPRVETITYEEYLDRIYMQGERI